MILFTVKLLEIVKWHDVQRAGLAAGVELLLCLPGY
jgi:hypothetical protein